MVTQDKKKESAIGIGGSVLVGLWVFSGVCHLLDWIGRAQTTMAITPYLGIFASPLAFIVEFIGAVGLLFYATRLEHAREAEDSPRIIRPWSKPEKPIRHWFWLKMGLGATVISAFSAAGFFFVLRSHGNTPSVVVTAKQQSQTDPSGTKSANRSATQKQAHESGETSKKSQSPSLVRPRVPSPKASSTGDRPKPLNLPALPETAKPVASPVVASRFTAYIEGKAIRATEKGSGVLYVSVELGEGSRYHGSTDDKAVTAVAEFLRKANNLVVFTGHCCDLRAADGFSVSFGMAPSKSKTIAYFDEGLASSCQTVRDALSALAGAMDCTYVRVPPASNDPNDVNYSRDFLILSGLDMEIVL